ncbi:hypothetical protein ABT010_38265 [Streptomyces sp. NPDC002668]|uniref:hypothetical protein n=1 Tax=Streptomyces sp. NPDC002668 TaxID=3154422 RepID=UPI00332F6F7F
MNYHVFPGGIMAHDHVTQARSVLGRLIEPGASSYDDYLDIAAEERADQVRSRLADVFRERPMFAGLMLRLDGHQIGVSTPARVASAGGTAGDAPEFGASDRAGLPGRSQQYKVIRFGCTTIGCPGTDVRSYYDPRTVPVCTVVAAHGMLALQR